MKPTFPLRTKVILLTVLNLVLLAILFVLFLRSQLEREFEAFLVTMGGARILAAAHSLSVDLDSTPKDERDGLLADYSQRYGVTFRLFHNRGGQVAGAPIALPREVRTQIGRRPPFRSEEHARKRPPGPRRDGAPSKHPPPHPPTGPPHLQGFQIASERPFLQVVDSSPRYWIGVRMGVPTDGGGPPSPGTLLLSSDTLFVDVFLAPWRPWLTLVGIALAIALACWLPFVRGVTKAISRMVTTTGNIAEGRFEANVPTNRGDELGLLGESINRMSKQLEALVHGQKRLLRDAAHELRSPLGRMQVALSILERDMNSTSQRDHVADLREEVQAMAKLTDQMLSFARADARTQDVQMEAVGIRDVVERAIRAERRDHPDIRVKLDPDLKVAGHEEMLFRCFSNLIRNAVLHGGISTPITISAIQKSPAVSIKVADRGPGVPEEYVASLFSPFFRVEAARSRNTGGSGLGLSIVKTCVEACQGSVECRNASPSGLEVTINLSCA